VAKKYGQFFRKGNGKNMREYILKQLRNLSCVQGKQKTWISILTDDQLYDLFLRLRNGEKAKGIARLIQSEWEINPDSSPHSISQGILKFKKRIAHLLISPTPCEAQNIYMDPFSDGCPDSGNSLESLDYIARLHRARIMKMLKEEENTGIKYPYLNRDLQALATLEKVLIKTKTFELFHEDPVQRGKIERKQKNIDKKFGVMMQQLGEKGKIQMVDALDKFLELAEKKAQTLESGPDGQLRLVKREKS
jgi:hypothetical protein